MDSKVFFGIIIVLFGLSLIFNSLFKINFPLFKIILAIVIIFFGIKLLMGTVGININKDVGEASAVFSSQKVEPQNLSEDAEYNAVFGSQVIDLRNTGINHSGLEVEVNSVFGSTKMYLPENLNVKVKSTGVFGSVRTPDGTNSSGNELDLRIEANAVFGNIEIYQ